VTAAEHAKCGRGLQRAGIASLPTESASDAMVINHFPGACQLNVVEEFLVARSSAAHDDENLKAKNHRWWSTIIIH
jgi:hypothetical protein